MKIVSGAQILLFVLAFARVEVLFAQTVVSFPDPNLEAAFRVALSKPTGPLTSTDLQSLTSFSAASRNITNLSGLEWATNLTWLALQQNAITNLTPVSGLSKLTSLNISENKMTQLAALPTLTKLGYLYMGGNQIADLSPLAALTNLTYLSAGPNWMTNLDDLANLKKLQHLSVGNNQLTNIAGVQGLTNLTYVSLSFNRLTNIAALQGLTNLTYVNVNFNYLDLTIGSPARTVIQVLLGRGATVSYTSQHKPPVIVASAPHILVAANTNSAAFGFDLWDDFGASQLVVTATSSNPSLIPAAAIQINGTNLNRSFTVTPTPNQTGLTVITLTVVDGADLSASVEIAVEVQLPTDVIFTDPLLEANVRAALNQPGGPLSSLTVGNLLTLSANGRAITNLSGLEWARSLTSLVLAENQISDVTPLAELKWLSELNLSYNPVSEWSAVGGLTNLTSLTLHASGITNIAFLQNLPKLRLLWVGGNRLRDLDALAGLPTLSAVFADANLLTNISGLLPLTNLIQANLDYNLLNLSTGSPALTTIQTLQSRGGWVTYLPQNQPPYFSLASTNLIIAANGSSTLDCYVWDDLTATEQISLGAVRSSDTSLLPAANLTLTANPNSGSGNYLLKATPALNQTGVAILTLTATDTAGLVTTNQIRVEVVIPQTLAGEPINCTNLTWLTAGHPGWSSQTNAAHDDLTAFQSGAGSSWLGTLVTGPGVLTFWWKGAAGADAPSESPVGGFTATCRESGQRGEVSVERGNDWEKITAVLPGGTWDLYWATYYPDIATNRLWLDDVSFAPGPTSAWIELQPSSSFSYFGFMTHGELGTSYLIESSPDLINWSVIDSVTFNSFQSWFTDYSIIYRKNKEGRFYRLRQETSTLPPF